jgi:hypothetical protein
MNEQPSKVNGSCTHVALVFREVLGTEIRQACHGLSCSWVGYVAIVVRM